jgi:hypothetical protein
LLEARGMRKLILLSSFASLTMFGCTTLPDGELIEAGDTMAAADDAEGKADSASSISFTAFDDDIGSTGTSETRKVFTTATSYKSYFGHKAPSSVDFSNEWVVFYSAGTQNTGGYTAAVESLSKSKTGLTLKVTTSLTSPGAGCFVNQLVTKPHTLAKFKKQPQVQYVQSYRDDQVKSCVTGPFCGGIAGIQCPGRGKCVDNPNDSCDPATGGADCGGYCTCIQTVACMVNSTFNSDPTVCACVPNDPCATTTCPTGSTCQNDNGTAVCLSPCATVKCAAGYFCKVTGNAVGCVPADGTCAGDSDCTIADDYCGGCACDALGPGQAAKTCSNPVSCFAEPCANKVPWCNPVSHKCEARPSTGLACGSNHCGTGEYCCNSSCGMCAKMGVFCIQIACAP